MNATPKTFRIDVKVRNNRIVARREALGLTVVGLHEATKIALHHLYYFESFRLSPLRENGEWRESARKLANFFRVGPEDLWPTEALLIEKTKTSMYVDLHDVAGLLGVPGVVPSLPPDAETVFLAEEVRGVMADVLTPIERNALQFSLDEEGSHQDWADKHGMSRERHRQIVEQAKTKVQIAVEDRPYTGQDDARIRHEMSVFRLRKGHAATIDGFVAHLSTTARFGDRPLSGLRLRVKRFWRTFKGRTAL